MPAATSIRNIGSRITSNAMAKSPRFSCEASSLNPSCSMARQASSSLRPLNPVRSRLAPPVLGAFSGTRVMDIPACATSQGVASSLCQTRNRYYRPAALNASALRR